VAGQAQRRIGSGKSRYAVRETDGAQLERVVALTVMQNLELVVARLRGIAVEGDDQPRVTAEQDHARMLGTRALQAAAGVNQRVPGAQFRRQTRQQLLYVAHAVRFDERGQLVVTEAPVVVAGRRQDGRDNGKQQDVWPHQRQHAAASRRACRPGA
jgi:hypothetical protein